MSLDNDTMPLGQSKLVSCSGDQAEALTSSPKIKHITFIGSEIVGRQVGTCTETIYCLMHNPSLRSPPPQLGT